MNKALFGIGVVIISLSFRLCCMERELIKGVDACLLSENFTKCNVDFFKKQTKDLIAEYDKLPGDEATLIVDRLRFHLTIVTVLNQLIECVNGSSDTKGDDTKQMIRDATRYLKSIMPYARQMQEVILSTIQKVLKFNSISEMEEKLLQLR